MCYRAFGLTKKQCQRLAYDFAVNNDILHRFNNEKKVAGRYWVEKFLKDHHLTLRTSEATSIQRLRGFNKVQVAKFFDVYGKLRIEKKFTADRIYNADESGILTVPNKLPKIISPIGMRRVSKIVSAERGKLVTIVCCMNGIGNFVPPFLIFPRKRMRLELSNGCPSGSAVNVGETGWMTSELFVKYLEHFNSFTRPSEDSPVLLLLDNHTTHITFSAFKFCVQNHIVLLGFPSHTTHRLQPMDVSFYKPLKTYFAEACDDFMVNNPGKSILEIDVGKLFGLAYPKAATISNAINGFKATGLEPFNPLIFQDEDFKAAETTDTLIERCSSIENNSTMDSVKDLRPACSMISWGKNLPKDLGNKVNATHHFILPELPKAQRKFKKRKTATLSSMVITSSENENFLMEKEQRRKCRLNRSCNKTNKVITDKLNIGEVSDGDYSPDENDESACIYCNELYKNSKKGDDWICCVKCSKWAHNLCAGVDKKTKIFKCELCD